MRKKNTESEVLGIEAPNDAQAAFANAADGGAEVTLDPQEKKPLKLDYGQTFKVGFAFAIIMLFWTAYDFVVPLLLEHAYGLPNSLRGLIMGLDNLLSLFMLPLFGKLSDNAHGKLVKKFGRRTPFIVIGTLASIILMIFVPVSTLKQQARATQYISDYELTWEDPAYKIENGVEVPRLHTEGDKAGTQMTVLEALLTDMYESGDKNYCDISYLNNNGISKETFINLKLDANLSVKKAVLNMLGAETWKYNGVEVNPDDHIVAEDAASPTYRQIKETNDLYTKIVAPGINNYESDLIYNKVTKTQGGASIGVYMVILLLVLVAMATFRSPAVALMPDVTPKPLRSQGNAIINLCGGIGGAIAFLIYTVALFKPSINTYVIIFSCVAAGMLLLLGGFLALVKERKMVEKCEEICKEYGIDDEEENDDEKDKNLVPDDEKDKNPDIKVAPAPAVDAFMTDTSGNFVADMPETPDNAEEMSPDTLRFAHEVVGGAKAKRKSPKEWWNGKTKSERSKLISFWLILASIFMWFMGYNAISSNLSVYITKTLNLSAGIASIISGVSMGISAIAFIPVGYMAAKIGRRKSIIIGFGLAVISFVLIFACVKPGGGTLAAALFALFYLIAGFGLIIANVNTFPMVTELSTAQTVGQYTGYYYMATMSAQAITPFIAGLVMDSKAGSTFLFIYSAVCVVAAIVLMLFVKHGDSMIIGKGRKLTKEEKRQIRLESLDSD